MQEEHPPQVTIDQLLTQIEQEVVHQPQKALSLCKQLYTLAEQQNDLRGTAYSFGFRAYALYMLSDHQQALKYLWEAYPIFEELDDKYGLATTVSSFAAVNLSLGNYELALEYGLRSVQMMNEIGNHRQEAWILNGLGAAYEEVDDLERSLKYHHESLAIFEALEDDNGKARALTGMATVYQKQGDYKKAQAIHKESLGLFRKSNSRIGEARALNDLGTVSQHLGDPDRALDYHRQSLEIRRAIGNRQSQSTSLINIGKVYLEQEQFTEALDVLHQSLEIAEAIKVKVRIYQSHHALSKAFAGTGDYLKALHHYKAYHRCKEQVSGEKTLSRIHQMQTAHDLKQTRQEAEIAHLRNVELKEKNLQLEQLLAELKTTQAQLIQSEKLASLGALTAGIAHEIKNPLNFVNNFARLTIDLAEELEAESTAQQDQSYLSDLIADIKFNARKINEHGVRADSIVRSMMLHAGGRSGQRQPTDVNALLEEYLNLAYHGLRARLDDFNATLERDLDPNVEPVDVVPAELGRVFLNLLNNAFYAIYEKAKQSDASYFPTVFVGTRSTEQALEIWVRDNGTGIPEDVRARIFEPFYTTKPTGSGTGLGLSLSYEIITQGHGGTLSVTSEPGAGAMFLITLPLP